MSRNFLSKLLGLLNDDAKVRHAQPQIMGLITHANEAVLFDVFLCDQR